MKPKIFIGIVTNKCKDYCAEIFAKSISEYNYPIENILIGIADNSPSGESSILVDCLSKYGFKIKISHYIPTKEQPVREVLANCRNMLRERFLSSDCDYFFSLESDVILPPETLQTLLDCEKDIVSAINVHTYGPDNTKPIVCVNWNSPYPNISRNAEWHDFYNIREENGRVWIEAKGDIFEVSGIGLGCVLISRRVLEHIPFRVRLDRPVFDDMFFCNDCIELGFHIWVCPKIVAAHLQGGWEGKRK